MLAGCCSYSSEVGGHFSHQYLSSFMVLLRAFVSSLLFWNAVNPQHPDHSFSWSGKLSDGTRLSLKKGSALVILSLVFPSV